MKTTYSTFTNNLKIETESMLNDLRIIMDDDSLEPGEKTARFKAVFQAKGMENVEMEPS